MTRDPRARHDLGLTASVWPCANGETREWRLTATVAADGRTRAKTVDLATIFESDLHDDDAIRALLRKALREPATPTTD